MLDVLYKCICPQLWKYFFQKILDRLNQKNIDNSIKSTLLLESLNYTVGLISQCVVHSSFMEENVLYIPSSMFSKKIIENSIIDFLRNADARVDRDQIFFDNIWLQILNQDTLKFFNRIIYYQLTYFQENLAQITLTKGCNELHQFVQQIQSFKITRVSLLSLRNFSIIINLLLEIIQIFQWNGLKTQKLENIFAQLTLNYFTCNSESRFKPAVTNQKKTFRIIKSVALLQQTINLLNIIPSINIKKDKFYYGFISSNLNVTTTQTIIKSQEINILSKRFIYVEQKTSAELINIKTEILLFLQDEIGRLHGLFFLNTPEIKIVNLALSDEKIFNENEKLAIFKKLQSISFLIFYAFYKRFMYAIGKSYVINSWSDKNFVPKLEEILDQPLLFDWAIDALLQDCKFNKTQLFYCTPVKITSLLKLISQSYEVNTLTIQFMLINIQYLKVKQLSFYMSQLYQGLAGKNSHQIAYLLQSLAQQSAILYHQLLWMARVESQTDTKDSKGKKPQTQKNLVCEIFFKKLQKNLFNDELEYFLLEDNFVEQVTAVSGKLNTKMETSLKLNIIKSELQKIRVPPGIYLPTNPEYQITKIKTDSGTPMQSAQRVPIKITFYCKKFEGPDKFLFKLKNSKINHIKDDEETDLNEKETSELPTQEIKTMSYKFIQKIESARGTPLSLKKSKFMDDGKTLSAQSNSKNFDYEHVIKEVYQYEQTQSMIQKKSKKTQSPIRKKIENPALPIAHEPEETMDIIFKVFDDIRQDSLSLQIIKMFDDIFKMVGIDLYLYAYKTISNRTGSELNIGGLIEVVPNSNSRDQIGKINQYSLYDYFITKFGSENTTYFQMARENFMKSMAAYSVVSYILQTKDRHNGNILVEKYGHIIHIDFGFIFDISPAGNLKFESANFKLTEEMIKIMGGKQDAEPFIYFMNQTIKAFLAIREHAESIFNIVELMSRSGMKCFRPMSLNTLRDRFMLKKSSNNAAKEMKKIILDAFNKWTTNVYDGIQYVQQKIAYQKSLSDRKIPNNTKKQIFLKQSKKSQYLLLIY